MIFPITTKAGDMIFKSICFLVIYWLITSGAFNNELSPPQNYQLSTIDTSPSSRKVVVVERSDFINYVEQSKHLMPVTGVTSMSSLCLLRWLVPVSSFWWFVTLKVCKKKTDEGQLNPLTGLNYVIIGYPKIDVISSLTVFMATLS